MDKTSLEGGINCKKRRRWSLVYFQVFVLFCLVGNASALRKTCGGFLDIGSGSSRFYSPNYPSQYNVASNCIWVIDVNANYKVSITFSFTGERYAGACSDYIQIRDGGPASVVVATYCDTHTSVTIESTGVLMTVQLRTDQISGSGTYLDATVQAVYNTTPSTSNRLSDCRSYEFECSNRVCISMSYRCDDYNDCGCVDDCDEDGCGSLPINLVTQVSISVVVGLLVFITICLMAYLIEGKNSWSAHKKKITHREKGKDRDQSVASRAFVD